MGGDQGKLRKPIRDGDLAAVKNILNTAADKQSILHEQFNVSGNPLEFAPVYYNPLQYAVFRDEVDIVQVLLENGADIHCRRNGGETLLHVAVHHGNLPLVDLLRTSGIDMKAVDEKGHYAIHRACYSYKDPKSLIEYLLEQGSKTDVKLQDFTGQTPLHHAAFGSNYAAAEVLLNNGADVNAEDEQGRTPYHVAKKHEKMKTVLLDHGADANKPDPLGG